MGKRRYSNPVRLVADTVARGVAGVRSHREALDVVRQADPNLPPEMAGRRAVALQKDDAARKQRETAVKNIRRLADRAQAATALKNYDPEGDEQFPLEELRRRRKEAAKARKR